MKIFLNVLKSEIFELWFILGINHTPLPAHSGNSIIQQSHVSLAHVFLKLLKLSFPQEPISCLIHMVKIRICNIITFQDIAGKKIILSTQVPFFIIGKL